MNKDVIYLEPEDDITDTLTKLQKAEQKIVALVPPQKAAIFRSAVNMKLIARAAKESEKAVVIVSADPAVVRLAMVAQIPVAKNLQSRPQIPTPEAVAEAQKSESVIDDDIEDAVSANNAAKERSELTKNSQKTASKSAEMPGNGSESDSKAGRPKRADDIELSDEDTLEDEKKAQNKPKKAKKAPKIDKTRKIILVSVFGGLALILVLVWAFVFAPAATIAVTINSSPSNFAEGISFTTNPDQENAQEGVFYAQQVTETEVFTADVEATGEKDLGEKATGEVTLEVQFRVADFMSTGYNVGPSEGGTISTTSGLRFVLLAGANFYWNGNVASINDTCDVLSSNVCTIRRSVQVRAESAGEQYNIPANTTWNSINAGGQMIGVTNARAMAGGTSRKVKIISQKDVDDARDKILNEHRSELEKKFDKKLSEQDAILIENTKNVEVKETNSNPAVDAEAAKATVTVLLQAEAYVVDKSKVEEFISAKVSLPSDQKIYSIGEPYFERFTKIEEPARLKTTIETGPTVTEESILEKAKGRKIGEVASLLRSINGVNNVDIRGSYFWVGSVPDDPNKITIKINIEEN